MNKLTTFQYNLIEDVFTRPMFYASSSSSRLIEALSYSSRVLTDEESQRAIESLCKRFMNCDGEVAKTMLVEAEIDQFNDLVTKIRNHRNDSYN